MPISNRRVPKYRHYKPKNLAVVRINGGDIYLGRYASPDSRERYHRLIAEWLGSGYQSPRNLIQAECESEHPKVNELILAYWRYAKSHYVKDNAPTREIEGIQLALRPLREIYGTASAAGFGPKKLKAVRQHLIEGGLCRRVVNARVERIKRLFKWAVAEELVPPSVYHGLQAVAGLTIGRTSARETEPIRPVPDLYVAAVLPFVTPHVAAMIKLQRLTGMRPGEVIIMRPRDIDIKDYEDAWQADPSRHTFFEVPIKRPFLGLFSGKSWRPHELATGLAVLSIARHNLVRQWRWAGDLLTITVILSLRPVRFGAGG